MENKIYDFLWLCIVVFIILTGKNSWKSLGYNSLQEFVNAMYESEAKQVEAMMKFIKVNGLLAHLKSKNWRAFAKGYNGAGFAKNAYDTKLAHAYRKYLGFWLDD